MKPVQNIIATSVIAITSVLHSYELSASTKNTCQYERILPITDIQFTINFGKWLWRTNPVRRPIYGDTFTGLTIRDFVRSWLNIELTFSESDDALVAKKTAPLVNRAILRTNKLNAEIAEYCKSGEKTQ